MTGIFLRIPRDGRYIAVDIDTMTDAELAEVEAFLAQQPAAISAAWVVSLARWIRDNVRAEPSADWDRDSDHTAGLEGTGELDR